MSALDNSVDRAVEAEAKRWLQACENDARGVLSDTRSREIQRAVDRAVEEAKKQRQFRNCEHQFGAYRDCTREARFCREHMEGAVAEDRAALVAAGDRIYGALRIAAGPYEGPADPLEPLFETWDALAHPPEPAP